MVRRVVVGVLVILAVLVAVVTMPARYVQHTILDTEGYVDVVGPLASEPAVQEAVARAITTEVTSQIDVEGFVDDALGNVAERDRVPDAITRLSPVLGPALSDQVDSLIARTSDKLTQSPAFTTLWISANEVGHGTAMRLLEDRSEDGVVDVENGVVSVPLDPFVEKAKQALIDRGLTIAEQIEPKGRTIVLFESDDLATAQDGVSWLEVLTPWLPVIVVALVAAAAAVTRRGKRLRTVGLASAVVAVVMLVLQLGILIAGNRALGSLNLAETGTEAVTLAVHAFLAPLQTEIWWAFGISAVVALVCYLGPWAYPRARGAITSRRTPSSTPPSAPPSTPEPV